MIILDIFYIISVTETFQLIIPSVLNILICGHYLPYFLERGGVRENSSYKKLSFFLFNIEYIWSLMTLCSKCLIMIFTFLSSVVKIMGVLKPYIMYLMKIEELFPLCFYAYTLITNTLIP